MEENLAGFYVKIYNNDTGEITVEHKSKKNPFQETSPRFWHKGKGLPIFNDSNTAINYYATVLAYDATPNYSAETSSVGLVTGVDTTAPANPTGFDVIARKGAFNFTWDKNSEPDMEQYEIYVTDNDPDVDHSILLCTVGHPKKTLNLGTKTDDESITLTTGHSYYFWLLARDRSGNPVGTPSESKVQSASAPVSTSDISEDDPTVPGVPTFGAGKGLFLTLDMDKAGNIYKVHANLIYDKPTNVEIRGFEAELYNALNYGNPNVDPPSGTLQDRKTPGKSDTTCKWTDKTPDTNYSARIKAISKWNVEGLWSGWANAFSTNDTTAPVAPTITSVVAKGGKFVIKFTQNSEIDAKEYRAYVYQTYTPASAAVIAREAHPKKKISIELGTVSETGGITLTSGTLYHFWLTCADVQGNESGKTYLGSATAVKGLKKSAANKIVDDDDIIATADNINDGGTYQLAGGARGYIHLDANGLVSGSRVYKTLAQLTVPSSYYLDLRGSKASTTTWTITADWLTVHDTSSPWNTIGIGNVSVTNTITTAGPAANGRAQAGAFTASSWIHMFVIYKSSDGTIASLSSASATTPTLPTGYDYFVRVSSVYLNSSTLIATAIQFNDIFWSDDESAFYGAGPSSTGVYESISIARQVPITAKYCFGFFGGTAGGAGSSSMMVTNATSGAAEWVDSTWNRIAPNYLYNAACYFTLPIRSGQTLYWMANRTNAEFFLAVKGWVDDL